jgi:general secretion pathway protein A
MIAGVFSFMYEAFYRFSEAPFRLTPDPSYLYLSRHHREALGHLLFGIREGSGFVAVTGEIGTGKTTLLRALLRDLEPTTIVAYLFNPALSDLELLQTINSELSLPAASTSKKELVDALNRFLLAQKLAGKRVVVIVDEAQALAPQTLEQLRLLSNLETETEKLLQIILVGQPELRALLRRPDLVQLNQRITIRWHLRPLDRDETVGYIRHRLRVAGGPAAVGVFTPSACRSIHRYAGGVPRVINIAAHHALLIGYTRDQQTIDPAIVRRAIAELRQHDGGPRPGSPIFWPALGLGMTLAAIAVAFAVLGPGDRWLGARRPTSAPLDARVGTGGSAAGAALVVPESDLVAGDRPAGASEPVLAADGPAVADPAAPAEPAPSHGDDAGAFWEMLASMDHRAVAMAATDDLLAAWKVDRLQPEERARPRLDLDAVARARGLRYLETSGTLARVEQLNLPAILELAVLPSGKRRFAMLRHLSDDHVALQIGEDAVSVTPDEVAEVWFGKAHIFWRDFERLPEYLAPGSVGTEIGRLQTLLARVGELPGEASLIYDERTEEAIARFQRSRRLEPDGIVGPLTKIVLYDALATYDHPRLSGGT